MIFWTRLAVTRRKTQAIAKRFAFHSNAIRPYFSMNLIFFAVSLV